MPAIFLTKNNMKTENRFDFKPGDVIRFCDENYYVIENHGSQGVVCPFGETHYIRGFQWEFGKSDCCVFVRKPKKEELERLGLFDEKTSNMKKSEKVLVNLEILSKVVDLLVAYKMPNGDTLEQIKEKSIIMEQLEAELFEN